MSCTSLDLPIGSFRLVSLEWTTFHDEDRGDVTTFIVHESEVESFVKASVELHYDPGINPYTKGKTRSIQAIRVDSFKLSGPFWWTTPGLDSRSEKKLNAGAILVKAKREDHSQYYWTSPEYKNRLETNRSYRD